ncbi:PD-(D/E)XK nuclease family protein [Salipaludibacillus aurantiacus]|uniref:PD-(D/E)XK nuclease superfamily protein n=1 Tax=Salipaludibacillus aurantiacus TaxID=1601833 RepID=A0A1H9UUE9_9BACI|nr:PD-(D/E)XK nuclease family protein [Salipaludibacillus aurantiacus]SES13160.1 PD-(D/E)XK nuclease superfamily protein [Salipaludibacillus aurantiacus]
MAKSKQDLEHLENFMMEIELLDQIETKLSVFNVFETLDIYHTEIRHSNVLAWLLKPQGFD